MLKKGKVNEETMNIIPEKPSNEIGNKKKMKTKKKKKKTETLVGFVNTEKQKKASQ